MRRLCARTERNWKKETSIQRTGEDKEHFTRLSIQRSQWEGLYPSSIRMGIVGRISVEKVHEESRTAIISTSITVLIVYINVIIQYVLFCLPSFAQHVTLLQFWFVHS